MINSVSVIRNTVIQFITVFIVTCLLSELAGADPSPRRPLVFIPGIIGSELWSGEDRLWGGINDIRHLDRLQIIDGPRDTLPLQTCSEKDRKDPSRLNLCGTIESFAILPPFNAEQYGPLFEFLKSLGYKRSGPDRNLFVFSYDWRRSNFETAKALSSYLEEEGLAGKPFDILAHSMGGLVALLYTRQYDEPRNGETCETIGKCRVQTVVTLGTPFFGSMSTVETADVGWGQPWNWIAGGRDTITKTVLSWPSIYELLPTYENCCYSVSSSGKMQPLDLTRFDDWKLLPFANGLPNETDRKIRVSLKRTLEIKGLAHRGFPKHIVSRSGACDSTGNRFFPVAGDHYETPGILLLKDGQLSFKYLKGDETVLLRSAAMGDVGRSSVSFVSHRKIFADPHIQAQLRRIFFRCELNINDYGSEMLEIELELRNGGGHVVVPIYSVGAHFAPSVSQVGQATNAVIELDLETFDEVVPPIPTLKITLDGALLYSGPAKPTQKAIPLEFQENSFHVRVAANNSKPTRCRCRRD